MAPTMMDGRDSSQEYQAWLDRALAGLVFVLLAAVYLWTLLPGLGGTEDSTKFQYTGAALGTPHNPGYPLYMVACYAFSKLPFGTLAYRINLLSAFWGATCATLVFLAMRRIAVHRWIAAFVALGLGLGRAFWAHSVITEAYTQVSAFTAAALLALLAWDESGRERWLYAAVAAASLAFGTHLIIAGAVPALAWFVLSRFRWRIPLRVLTVMATIVALGFAQYGYVWIRSVQGASPLESRATTLGELVDVLRARQFQGQMFKEPPLVVLQTRVPEIAAAALTELGGVGCAAALLGVMAAWRYRRRVAVLLALGAAGPALLLMTLGGVATTGILLPALMPCWILAGAGFGYAWTWVATAGRRAALRPAGLFAVGLLVVSLPAAQLRRNFAINDHHDDTYDDQYVTALFETLHGPTAFVNDEHRFWHMLHYQRYVTGMSGLVLNLPRDPETIETLLRRGYTVYAFSGGIDELDGRVRARPVTLAGPSVAERLRGLPAGQIVVMAGWAARWPAAPSLRLGDRAPGGGRAVVVALQGLGPVVTTQPGFEGVVSVRQGDPLGDSGQTAPMDIRVEVYGERASIAVAGEPVAVAERGLAVAEIGSRLNAAYVLRPDANFRAPFDMSRRALYRILEVTPPDSCAAVGHGAWTRLMNPGTEARLVGRINGYGPFDAIWLAYVAASGPLPARLAEWAGPGEPVLSVDQFEPQHDLARLQRRLASDQFEDTGDLLSSPSVTRLAIKVNDRGEASVFRINLGARPEQTWVRAAVDKPHPDRAGACAAAVDWLHPDAGTFQARVYLGPGGDWYFGSGWRGPEPVPAGFHRRMAGSDATMLLPVEQPAVITLRLSVEALNGESGVALALNGRDLAPLSLVAGWNELAWRIDAEAWRGGLNDLSIHAIGQADSPVLPSSRTSLRFRRVVLDWSGSKY
jgi:hypothetical protein